MYGISDQIDWLLAGDFNEIRYPHEHDGCGQFDHVGASDFNLVVEDLIELDNVGGTFTWSNGFSPQHTRTKLDRAFGNQLWIDRWAQVRLSLLHGNTSDHTALLIELIETERAPKPFHFLNNLVEKCILQYSFQSYLEC